MRRALHLLLWKLPYSLHHFNFIWLTSPNLLSWAFSLYRLGGFRESIDLSRSRESVTIEGFDPGKRSHCSYFFSRFFNNFTFVIWKSVGRSGYSCSISDGNLVISLVCGDSFFYMMGNSIANTVS